MQLVFDVNRSLKENPPNYGKGITHIQRKSGKLSGLKVVDSDGNTLQPRELTLEDGQRKIKKSFSVHNVIYDKEVMVAEERENQVEELVSGYGRYGAFGNMGVDTYFWDVVKFDSPYWREVWKRKFNARKDHIAKGTPNSEGTYIKGLVAMKSLDSFDDADDHVIREALFDMSNGELELDDIEKLLKKFRKSNSKFSTIKAFTKKEANDAATALGLPCGGYVKNVSSLAFGKVGYLLYGGDLKDKILDMAKYYDFYKQKISITGYIQNTELDEEVIKKSRKLFVEQINNSIELIKQYLDPKYHDMIKFEGFLAQILVRDKFNGGLPKEVDLVDEDGNPWKRLDV
jgi:hypothetical protein|tara:strand:+ start:126 stop:1157 length:1032 start_codon:yes stop_codon:yes gene_type:complete